MNSASWKNRAYALSLATAPSSLGRLFVFIALGLSFVVPDRARQHTRT